MARRHVLLLTAVFLLVASGPLTAKGEVPTHFFDTHCCGCHNADDANAEIRLDDAHLHNWSQPVTSAFFERVLKVIRDGQMPPDDAAQPTDDERDAAVDALHSSLLQPSDRR